MKIKVVWFLCVLVGLVSACTRTNPRKACLSGAYKGSVFLHEEGANALNGYFERDSLYQDEYQVTLNKKGDSVVFTHSGNRFSFLYDKKDKYTETYGTHSHRIFSFIKDSLYVEYFSYGGYTPYYNQINMLFKGKKTQ